MFGIQMRGVCRMAEVIGLAVKHKKRAPMNVMNFGYINHRGLLGEHRGRRRSGNGPIRQVTVISEEQWREACAEVGIERAGHARRANVCVSGLSVGPEDVGKYITIGDSVMLEITGETTPCERMDEIHPGLRAALAKGWRGGVTCSVEIGGIISVGDPTQYL